jgi:hypothetical protein
VPLLSGVSEEPTVSQIDSAAVRDEIKQHAAGLGHVNRLDDGNGRNVFHHPARVAWRKFEIGNDGV